MPSSIIVSFCLFLVYFNIGTVIFRYLRMNAYVCLRVVGLPEEILWIT
jgi:hypothetical protein